MSIIIIIFIIVIRRALHRCVVEKDGIFPNQGGGGVTKSHLFLKHSTVGLALGFLFICIGDGCTAGDYILMILLSIFTTFCCFCCYGEYREYKEYTWNTEDQQPNDINLAEVFSQESRQELTRLQHLEEEREREQGNNTMIAPNCLRTKVSVTNKQ